MSGSISLSLSQQFDSLGKPLSGGLLYTYQAGTTTPQSAYQDTGLVTALPNPITLDAAGRVPQLFFADGNIKVRLTDANGVVQLAADNILVIGPSAGGGGGATVDPTTLLQSGWVQPIYGTGVVTGFVRANGRTIGNASSGASERANADTVNLFTFLYNADPNLTVSTGRGASAAADYAANKTITLPDFRGRVLAALDDMGNSAAGRLTSSYFGATATTLGASGGGESETLTAAQLPPITSTGSAAAGGGAAFTIGNGGNETSINAAASGTATVPAIAGAGSWTYPPTVVATVTSTGTNGNAHNIVQPTMLVTIYLKL